MVEKKIIGFINLILITTSLNGMQSKPTSNQALVAQHSTLPSSLTTTTAPIIVQQPLLQPQSIIQNYITKDHQDLLNDYNELSKNPNHIDALTCAITKKNIKNIQVLFSNYFNETYRLICLFIRHAKASHLQDLIGLVIKNNILWNLDYVPLGGSSLLTLACKYLNKDKTKIARVNIIKLLLAHGASIQSFVINNQQEAVKLFIQNKARLNHPSNRMLLPEAIRRNFVAITELLLNNNIQTNHHDDYGRTLMCAPLIEGYYEIIKLLRKHNIPPFVPNSLQETFVRTVEQNNIADVKKLLRFTLHEEALTNAIKNNDEQTVQRLIVQRLNGHAINEKGEHLLTIATRNKNQDMVWLLVHFGHANLRYLVEQGDYKTVAYVLECLPCHFSREESQWLLSRAQVHNNHAMIKLIQEYMEEMDEYREEGLPHQEPPDLTEESENKFISAMEHYTEGFQQQPELPHHTYTQSELDFWYAVRYSNNKKAQELLQQYRSIRLAMPNRPCPGHTILSYALTVDNQALPINPELIQYLLKNHFESIYPLIQQIVSNSGITWQKEDWKQVMKRYNNYLQLLLKLGCDVNKHPASFSTAEHGGVNQQDLRDMTRTPQSHSLLHTALKAHLEQNNNINTLTLLLDAGASIPLLLEEIDYELYDQVLEILRKALLDTQKYKPLADTLFEVSKLKNTAQRTAESYDAWDLGIALYKALTHTDAPETRIPAKIALPETIVLQERLSARYRRQLIVTENDVDTRTDSMNAYPTPTSSNEAYQHNVPYQTATASQSTSSVSSSSSSSQTTEATTNTSINAATKPTHHLRHSVDYDNLSALLPSQVSQ